MLIRDRVQIGEHSHFRGSFIVLVFKRKIMVGYGIVISSTFQIDMD